jgi:hypothetical protein
MSPSTSPEGTRPRLHFWRLPDGRAELASVVTHDDLTIA